MGRVYFPTVSLNRFGVRDTDQQATLGGMPAASTLGAVQRFPAEPTPRAAMTPTGPLLGGMGLLTQRMIVGDGWTPSEIYRAPIYRPPIRIVSEATPPAAIAPPVSPWLVYTATPAAPSVPPNTPQGTVPAPIISSSGGGGSVAPSPAPAGIYSPAPTPVASTPPPSNAPAVLVTSGGGTAAPATAPAVAAAPTSVWGGITAWLSGSTPIFGYNVPNALLAAGVALGFAALEGGSTSGRRR